MAWVSIGSIGTAANTANNQASIALTVGGNNVGVGEVGVVAISQDNPGAADTFTTVGTANPVVSTVTDSAGNVWLCAGEQQNAQGAAQAGVSCSLWYTLATANLPPTGTVTATFVAGSSASFDESAISGWVFSIGAGSSVSLLASTGLATDASTAAGSLDILATTGANLRFRAVAIESSLSTPLTTSSGWDDIVEERSAAIATATGIRGEFLISASSTAASAPSLNTASLFDSASVYMVLQEVPASDGAGAGEIDFAASGVITGDTELVGNANIDIVADGVGASFNNGFGTAVIDFSASAIAENIQTGAGDANIDFVVAGAGTGIVDSVGAAVVDFDNVGVATSETSTGAGEANIAFTAAAVAQFRRKAAKTVHTSLNSGRSVTGAY